MAASVDVVLLTLNSERILNECLQSIYENVPVNQLIVVDGYSQDKTLEILNKFNQQYGNVKVIFDRGNRATARQKGISQVATEWFMFVDSDVVLCRNWFQKAQKCLSDDVGAVWGIEVWSTISNPKTLKLFLVITRKIFEVRGGTHDTLIRTSMVKDIKIPNDLHVFEDAYIKDWVTAKGYRVIACYSPFCIHYRPETVWTLRGSLGLVAEAFRLGHPRLIGKLLAAYAFYTVYSAYQLVGAGKN
jgi:glycosyltransferase involved in cell wall biosynthesis